MKMRSFVVWIVLVFLTFVTYTSPWFGLPAKTLVIATLCIALVKAQLVADNFMGLVRVGGIWRWLVSGYLLMVGAGIAGAFLS